MIPKITLLDSGEWSNEAGVSFPRMYSPLREAETLGKVEIDEIFYVPSPDRFADLDIAATLEKTLLESRHAVEKERVAKTGRLYNEAKIKDFKGDARNPICCVNLRPSPDRNTYLKKLCDSDMTERILLAPPLFSNANELIEILSYDKEQKIVMWLPYRFSAGVMYTRQHLKDLAVASMSLVSGPFDEVRWCKEFIFPFVDAFLTIAGRPTEYSILHSENRGLCTFRITAEHEASLVTTLVCSTVGTFQADHVAAQFLSYDRSNISLSNSLTAYVHQKGTETVSSSPPSHDPPTSLGNGARILLEKACFPSEAEPSEDEPKLPTLEAFAQTGTQSFIDAMIQSFSGGKK